MIGGDEPIEERETLKWNIRITVGIDSCLTQALMPLVALGNPMTSLAHRGRYVTLRAD
jgi:hypothetical protein